MRSFSECSWRPLPAGLSSPPHRSAGLSLPLRPPHRDRRPGRLLPVLFLLALAGLCAAAAAPPPPPPGVISGELKKWHCVTITFEGPPTSETERINPFKDTRLDVVFSQGAQRIRVPGYYAADGRAAETGAAAGGTWRVHFTPPAEGRWHYRARFQRGANIAGAPEGARGTPLGFDGAAATFTVGPAGQPGADLGSKGTLHAGGPSRYPHFANGEAFLNAGAASPENLLAYFEIDQTRPSHQFVLHAANWQPGDPTWRGGMGKNIIGALNYLAGKGMNAVTVKVMNVRSGAHDVWPWTSESERYRFDCSKLDQWEIIFSHMDRLGLAIQLVTQDAGNDHLLDGGYLGLQRKLFYRELAARFGHHPGLIWNLGDQITNSPDQIKEFADAIKRLDPYDHPIVVSSPPRQESVVYDPLLGNRFSDGIALQGLEPRAVYDRTLEWIQKSQRGRRPWFVLLTGVGSPKVEALPDSIDPAHDALRKEALWGNLMAGGAGVAWKFGTDYPNGDLTCESWRSRDHLWDLTRHALDFFRANLPFDRMEAHNELLSGAKGSCLAEPGQVYAVYLPEGGSPRLNLGSVTADFSVRWFNPRQGGALAESLVRLVHGPGEAHLGTMITDPGNEWVVLVKRVN